jgi:hypothetical protein
MKDDDKKSSFRHWQLILIVFIAPLPILVRCKTKGAAGAVCAIAIRFLIANFCIRWRGIFKGLSQAEEGADFSLCAALFTKYLSNEPSFGRMHLAAWTIPLAL